MKIGLFLCDHVNQEYQKTFGDYTDMFIRLFPEYDFQFYDAINGDFPKDLEECDLYMATGSRYSAYENMDWIVALKRVIQDIYKQNKCFIGFCFGHQLLAEALGGKVEKSDAGWCISVDEFSVLEKESWMQPRKDSFSLLMMCQDQVVRLPQNAKVLAGNEKCPIGMFQVGERILGIQGHPEYSRAYNQLLMENRVERIGDKVVSEGIIRLKKNIDTTLIKRWIDKFVAQI